MDRERSEYEKAAPPVPTYEEVTAVPTADSPQAERAAYVLKMYGSGKLDLDAAKELAQKLNLNLNL